MKTFFANLLVFSLFLSPFPATAGDNATQAVPDLKQTEALVQSWAGRESFPDSIPLAYYTVYSLAALGKELPGSARKRTIDFIRSCRRDDGGYGANPLAASSATVFTYHAVATLKLLQALDSVDAEATVSHIRALVTPAGGVKAAAKEGRADLGSTYYALAALQILNAGDILDRDKAIRFIMAFKEPGSGFGLREKMPSTPASTMFGVRALAMLNALDAGTRRDVAAYLRKSRYSGLNTGKKYPGLPKIADLAAVLVTAQSIGSLDQLNLPEIGKFINSLYIPANGGFGPQPGYGTTPPSTYHALRCLAVLGQLKDPLAAPSGVLKAQVR